MANLDPSYEPYSELEASDAKKVDSAIIAIENGDLVQVCVWRMAVIRNTPAPYVFTWEDAEVQYFKFWTQEDFLYQTMRDELLEQGKMSVWMPNAYGRAALSIELFMHGARQS